MKLFKVSQKKLADWDETQSVTVRAKSEADARRLATRTAGSEGEEVWSMPERTVCDRIMVSGEEAILAVSRRNG